jgi:hypothetical protein
MSDLSQDTIIVPPNSALVGASPTRTFKDADGKHYSGTVPVALDGTPLGEVLSDIKTKTDNLDVALSTRTKPSDTQIVSGTVAVTSSYLDTKLSEIKALLEPLPVWSIGPVSVSGGASLDLRPDAGDEIRIENFTYDGDIELYVYDGTLQLVTAFTGPNASYGYTFRSTHERYYQIQNTTAGAFLITAEGMYTTKV